MDENILNQDSQPQFSPGEKKVASKVLNELGWGSRKIEEWLGVDHVSVWRYAKEPTPDELKQFETEFKAVIDSARIHGLAVVYNRLLELAPRERRIDQLIKLAEFFQGNSTPLASDVNTGRPLIIITDGKQQPLDKQ